MRQTIWSSKKRASGRRRRQSSWRDSPKWRRNPTSSSRNKLKQLPRWKSKSIKNLRLIVFSSMIKQKPLPSCVNIWNLIVISSRSKPTQSRNSANQSNKNSRQLIASNLTSRPSSLLSYANKSIKIRKLLIKPQLKSRPKPLISFTNIWQMIARNLSSQLRLSLSYVNKSNSKPARVSLRPGSN